MAIYAARMKIELLFKRYKSIFQLDHLRAHDPQLVQTYLLAKLLAALLVDPMLLTTQELVLEWFSSREGGWELDHRRP